MTCFIKVSCGPRTYTLLEGMSVKMNLENKLSYLEERHKVGLGGGVELFVQSAGEFLSLQSALLG